jgi:hypothetical protein
VKRLWDKLSVLSQYYIVSVLSFFLWWSVLSLFKIEFTNGLFFTTSFVWHFTLLTPGLKEKMLTKKQRFSFINVVVRTNYYLQLFINVKKWKFGPSLVRALSPLCFTLLLILVGGNGNVLFTIMGSIAFESAHYLIAQKITLEHSNDPEIPPAIPNAESSHE